MKSGHFFPQAWRKASLWCVVSINEKLVMLPSSMSLQEYLSWKFPQSKMLGFDLE